MAKVDSSVIASEFQETQSFCHYFVSSIISRIKDNTDFRPIFDHIVSDLLKVCYFPQFPLAVRILGFVISKLSECLDKE